MLIDNSARQIGVIVILLGLLIVDCNKETSLEGKVGEVADLPLECLAPGETDPANVSNLPTGVVEILGWSNGVAVAIVGGEYFVQDPTSCGWTNSGTLYDLNFFVDNYQIEGSQAYLIIDPIAGTRVPVGTEFSTGFEGIAHVRELITTDFLQFSTITLQSPLAKTVAEYVDLFQCIVLGTCDFRDNRISPDITQSHGGLQSLKYEAMAPLPDMVTSKASIQRDFMFFRKGDTIWFEGWFYAAGGWPFSLVDFESTWLDSAGGPRIVVKPNDELAVELKFVNKPEYKQTTGSELSLPLDQWVSIKCKIFLDNTLGQVQVWQDGQLIIDGSGPTLPLANTVINSMEIGISATGQDSTLWVDDLTISGQAIP